jgi:hypothetical protein
MKIVTERFMENIAEFPKARISTSLMKYWRNLAIMSAGIEVSEMELMGEMDKYKQMNEAYFRKVGFLTNKINTFYEPDAALVMPPDVTVFHFQFKLCTLNAKESKRRVGEAHGEAREPVNGLWLWTQWETLKRDCGNECLEIFNDICPGGVIKSGQNLKAVMLELRGRIYGNTKKGKAALVEQRLSLFVSNANTRSRR